MYQDLKSEIREIIEIVKECPESLQAKCFELLLENYLSANSKSYLSRPDVQKNLNADYAGKTPEQDAVTDEPGSPSSEDIKITNFHIKIQKFLKENDITDEMLNKLYYKENGKLMPFYETLKNTSMATCQIRLALLTAFENCYAEGTGEFAFNCEVVRERCKTMKCYNATNFATNFKKNDNLWDNYPEKYDGNMKVSLSNDGKKELAKVLFDLVDGE